MFVPGVCRLLLTLTDNDEVQNEEHLDDELLFNLLLLSEVISFKLYSFHCSFSYFINLFIYLLFIHQNSHCCLELVITKESNIIEEKDCWCPDNQSDYILAEVKSGISDKQTNKQRMQNE